MRGPRLIVVAAHVAWVALLSGLDRAAAQGVRRFLSRFMVVVVVALAIEALVATFKAVHEDMSRLAYAAGLLFSVGVALAGWGLFVRLNRYAKEFEPEAMEAAKRENRKLK